MTFEKYARSPAEWLESLYYYLVTKQAWKYEKLNEKILISGTFFDQVLSSVTNLHKSTGQFTSWYRIQNLSKLFIQLRLDFFLSEEVNHIQIFIYYGHDLSQQLPQPWLCWPPPWKLKPIISYFPDYYRSEQERLIIWHFKRYLISVWCRAVQFSHKEAALNEHLNDLQMKFGPMRLSSTTCYNHRYEKKQHWSKGCGREWPLCAVRMWVWIKVFCKPLNRGVNLNVLLSSTCILKIRLHLQHGVWTHWWPFLKGSRDVAVHQVFLTNYKEKSL